MASQSKIEIKIAGPIRVVRSDGADLTPRGAKVRGLVLLLALAPELRRGRAWLQDRLWSDRAPEQGAASLRQALSELRGALGPDRDCLVARDGYVGFDTDRIVVRDRPAAPVAGHAIGDYELAEGLDIRDPEFEHWIRDQRAAFAERAKTAPAIAAFSPTDLLRRPLRIAAITMIGALVVAVAVAAMRPAGNVDAAGGTRSIPSIAVLPFTNLGDDPASDMLVTGVSADIVTDLSKFGDLFVVAAESSFRFDPGEVAPGELGDALQVRYVVQGSVQWLDAIVRVNAQVIETDTGRSVWAERFEGPRDDLLKLQNDVVRHVVGAVGPLDTARGSLRQPELDRIGRLPTRSLGAFDHYLRGVVRFEEATSDGNAAARVAFSRAAVLDPRYAKAYAMQAWTHLSDYRHARSDPPEAALGQAEALAERALSVDPSEPYSHWAMGAVRLFQKRHDLAIAAYRRAIELNPNGADLMVSLGLAQAYAGMPRTGLASMESAVARHPHPAGSYRRERGFARFIAGDYARAVAILEQRNPKTAGTWEVLAAAYAMLGDADAAAAAMDRLLADAPGYSLAHTRAVEPFARLDDLDRYIGALRAAGAPERPVTRSGRGAAAEASGRPR